MQKKLVCYECHSVIPVPEDFIGNTYVLLETHYFVTHGVDLRTVNWDKPKRVIDIEDHLEKFREQGKPPQER